MSESVCFNSADFSQPIDLTTAICEYWHYTENRIILFGGKKNIESLQHIVSYFIITTSAHKTKSRHTLLIETAYVNFRK